MSDQSSFSDILNKSFDDIKFPKIPVGTYVGVVKGLPRFDVSTKKQTPFAEVQIQLYQAMDDVDQDELEEFETESGPISEKTMPLTFWYKSEGGMNRLKTFITNCGIDLKGHTPTTALEATQGKTLLVEVKHVNSQDGQSQFAQIDGTAEYK